MLAALDLELRAVLVLHELEEMTMADIATTLDLAPGTVASRLRRARAAFSENVAHYHTPLDRRENLSTTTLQQHGDNMLGVAELLDDDL